jgi:hypothetical protein
MLVRFTGKAFYEAVPFGGLTCIPFSLVCCTGQKQAGHPANPKPTTESME